MSWGLGFIAATKGAAIDEVTALQERGKPHFPEGARDAIIQAISLMPSMCPVAVESNGHVDSENGNLTITVKSVRIIGAKS